MSIKYLRISSLIYSSGLVAFLLTGCSSDPNKQKRAYLQSGDKYFQRARYQEAVIQFRNAIEIDPRFAEAHWQLARTFLRLRNSEAAFRELHETVRLEPRNADAELELAALYLARRQYAEAQAAVQVALKTAPQSARAHAILGEKYLLTHDREKAVEELRKAVEADPQRVEGYAALGAAYMAAGKAAEAENAYRKAIEVNARSVQAHLSLGEFWFSQRKLAGAETEMRAAAGLDPHAVLPRLFLARILLATNRVSEGEQLYSELKKVAPDDPSAYQALGLFYLSSGQREKAAAEFQSMLASKPKDAAVKANLIAVLIDLKRIHEADRLNTEVLRENPGDPPGLQSNGRILLAEGKYQEAATALQAAIKSEPNCARCYYFLGEAQAALGVSDLAKVSLSRARELAPQMSAATAVLAHLDANSGHYDDAMQMAGKALQANPDLVSAYVTEARALISKGDLPKAEEKLEEALKRDSASLPAAATLLSLDLRQGKTQAAASRISSLLDRNPENPGLHVLLGVAYLNLKDFDKSEAQAHQALTLDPKAKDAYTLWANIDMARGAFEQAKTHFRAAIESNPSGVVNYLALATLYEKDGNWEEAKKLCEKARQIDTGSPVVANHLASLYLDHGGDVNVAVSLAQVAKQGMPESPATTDTLGWAYYKLGSAKAALSQLTESVKQAPRNPMFQYHLGMAYLSDGRPDLARLSLQAALSSDPHFPDAASARAALDQASRPSLPVKR
jgi:tetratricopeptide (TPR) repeat protein